MTPDATIRLVRPSAWHCRFRAYAVFIDDQKVGTIRNGKTVDFPVSAGLHQLRIQVDWSPSNTLEFDVYPGSLVQFACGSGSAPQGQHGIAALSGIPGAFISLWPHSPPET